MTDIELAWTLPAPALLGLAAAAIALLLLLIIKLRLHAFVALVVVSVLTALAAGITPGDVYKAVNPVAWLAAHGLRP